MTAMGGIISAGLLAGSRAVMNCRARSPTMGAAKISSVSCAEHVIELNFDCLIVPFGE